MARQKHDQYVYPYSLEDLRSHILTRTELLKLPGLDPAGARYMDALWDELVAVSGVRAWRAATGLCGQLLEAALKHRLTMEGVRPIELEGSRGTLGAVLEMARRKGIYVRPAVGLTVGGSIFAAQQARNMASHASPWQEHPSERRATISLCLLVCYLGHLFPLAPAPVDEDSELGKTSETPAGIPSTPAGLLQHIRASRAAGQGLDRPELVREMTAAVRTASAGSLCVLITAALDEGWAEPLRSRIAENFVYVLSNSARGAVKRVEDLVTRLASLGLRRVHSPMLASVLPRDETALTYFLARSPNRFARYLYLCERSDPEMFTVMWRGRRLANLERHLEQSIGGRTMPIANLGNVLSLLPAGTRRRILHDQAARLREWLTDEPVIDAIAVLGAFRRDSQIWGEPAFVDLVSVTTTKIEGASDVRLGALGNRLDQLELLDKPFAEPLVHALLRRVPELSSADRQRVLWDLLAFAPRFRPEVVEATRAALAAPADGLANRDVLALAGGLIAAGEPVDVPVPGTTAAELLDSAGPEVDRFRLARLVLAADRGDGLALVQAGTRVRALRILRGTRTTQELSRRLVAEARRALERQA